MADNLFLIADGLDGCGKTTLIDTLSKRIHNGDQRHHRYSEPSMSTVGVFLRNLISNQQTRTSSDKELLEDSRAMSLLFAADRVRSMSTMSKSLVTGNHVLCDRWFLSSLVYQNDAPVEDDGAINKKFNDIFSANKFLLDGPLPNLIVFLKIDAATAFERIKRTRKLAWFETEERMKRQEILWEKAVSFYEQVFERRIFTVDATASNHVLCTEVLAEITLQVPDFWEAKCASS